MINKVYQISSLGYRAFLLLLVPLAIFLKLGSSTGTDYIPVAFYLLLAIPILSFILFNKYLNIDQQKVKPKSLLRWTSLLFLLLTLSVQGLIIYDMIGNSIIPDIIAVIVFAFFLQSFITFFGVLTKNI